MRGTLIYIVLPIFLAGIIPAYAGNTSVAYPPRKRGRDHPRVCGEHFVSDCSVDKSAGSSPRMRGTLKMYAIEDMNVGIIPAYAGNTTGVVVAVMVSGDHPRVCGEHFGTARGGGTHRGSSPRMRGTPRRASLQRFWTRIIPAYAGNTLPTRSVAATIGDHPRVCGEHPTFARPDELVLGSSPRMRGTLRGNGSGSGSYGIIPAYAGNTPVSVVKWRNYWDHPRVCGEHPYCNRLSYPRGGSSPRMRGTRDFNYAVAPSQGIIPAYAGNTPIDTGDMLNARDHPRVCGEHFNAVRSATSPQGSSPRMRGTLYRELAVFGARGIIPAYAGNTLGLRNSVSSARDHPRVCGEHELPAPYFSSL